MTLDNIPECLAVKDHSQEPVIREREDSHHLPAHNSILGLSCMLVGLFEETPILSAALH